MSRALGWIFEPASRNREAWLLMNLLYFGVVILGAIYSFFDPAAQRELLQAVGEAFSPTGSLGPVIEAYQQGNLLPAILLTFLVNLFGGSFLVITVPSLVIPFAGVAAGMYRAALWGILFSPASDLFSPAFLPHLLTVLLEGEAYVMAMLGVWLWWWPVVTSPGRRWRDWKRGLALQGRVYVAVAFLLALAAIYEVLEVVYLVPRLV